MILTPTGAGPQWTSLARRGMLRSEVQIFDVHTLGPHGIGPDTDPDCHELLYCVTGSCTLAAPSVAESRRMRLLAGQCIVIAPGGYLITAGGSGATIVRVRVLPTAHSRRLPPRRPSV